MINILINKYKNLHWPKKFLIKKSVLIFIIILSVILSISSLSIKGVECENTQVVMNNFSGDDARSRYFIIGDPPEMAFVSRYQYGAPYSYIIRESYPSKTNQKDSIMIDPSGFIVNTMFIFLILALLYFSFVRKYTIASVKKILLLSILFDFLFIPIITITMLINQRADHIGNFDVKKILITLAVFFIPASIPAIIASKIQRNSDKKTIIKRSVAIIIIFLIYFFMVSLSYAK